MKPMMKIAKDDEFDDENMIRWGKHGKYELIWSKSKQCNISGRE